MEKYEWVVRDLQELVKLLKEKAEANLVLLIAYDSIHLNSKNGQNTIYVLEVDSISHASGGRVGGFGQRKFKKVYGFNYQNGICEKILETTENLDDLNPGYVVRLPIELPDGEELMASCSIDSLLVEECNKKFEKILSKNALKKC